MDTRDAAAFSTWVEKIHSPPRPNIDVAVRRTISAMAIRGEPVDALIDLVIVWENLFGTSQGESTLRISAALAWLLGSTSAEREEVQARAADVYRVRSAVVHGRVVHPTTRFRRLRLPAP